MILLLVDQFHGELAYVVRTLGFGLQIQLIALSAWVAKAVSLIVSTPFWYDVFALAVFAIFLGI